MFGEEGMRPEDGRLRRGWGGIWGGFEEGAASGCGGIVGPGSFGMTLKAMDEYYAGRGSASVLERGMRKGELSNSALASRGSWMVEKPKGCISRRDGSDGGGGEKL